MDGVAPGLEIHLQQKERPVMTQGKDVGPPNEQAEALLPFRETLELTSQWGQPVPTAARLCELPKKEPTSSLP